jgi:hypothetical protein
VIKLSEEIVEVTVKLPKAVVEFLKAMHGNVEEHIARDIIGGLVSYIECVSETRLLPETMEGAAEKYGLVSVFKARGVLPSYWEV